VGARPQLHAFHLQLQRLAPYLKTVEPLQIGGEIVRLIPSESWLSMVMSNGVSSSKFSS
jgi:hypothetical protein